MDNGNLRKRKFDYKWVIVGLSFLMVMTGLGFCSSGKSLYLAAITKALGISRSAFSINDSCRYVTTAIINVFFGGLLLRFGQKKLICAGFLSLIASCLIYSCATNIFVFYIGGVLLGLGLSWTTTTMVSSIIYKWCHKNQGTIMGAVLASNGIGAAVAAQIVSPIIYNPDNLFGYQEAYKLVAVILAFVLALVLIFLKEPPKSSQNPTVAGKKSNSDGWIGIRYSEAVKKPYFYGASVCIFFTGLILQGMSGVAIPHLNDIGMDAGYVATVLSFSSLALAASKFLTGFIFDRCGLKTTMNICLTASILVMIVLTVVTNSPLGKVLAIAYGVLSSIALPLETIMLPLYASALFGQRSFDKILGLFVSINTAGYAVGTPVVNWCFDFFGSYRPAFIASGIIMLIIAISLQFVFSAAKKEKEKVLAEENK